MTEQADVVARRSYENRHFVERNTRTRFVQNPPGDLDALPAFARSGEDPHVTERPAFGWLAGREDVPLEGGQIRRPPRFENDWLESQDLEAIQRGKVPERNRDENIRGSGDQLRGEIELDRRVQRHIEQEQRELAIGSRGLRCRFEQRSAIGCGSRRELILEAFQKSREVGTAERQRSKRGRVDSREHQLVERARERAWESWSSRDRAEVVQPSAPRGFECGSRRHCFAPDERDGCDTTRCEDWCCEPCRELGDAETMQADGAAAGERDGTGEVVRRAPRRRDDQDARAVRARRDPGTRLGEALRGVGRFDDAERWVQEHADLSPGRHAGSPEQPRTAAAWTTISLIGRRLIIRQPLRCRGWDI